MIKPYYQDEHATIYHGDMTQIMPELQYDLIVTDPPYGIEAHKRAQPGAVQYRPIIGDSDTAAAAALLDMLNPSKHAVIFGANNFPELLPHKGRWLCWDKRLTKAADRMMGASFELAWTSKKTGFGQMIRCLHGGVVNANGHGLTRVHPTEKPVPMLREVMEKCPPGTVLDPFAGSGTTLRAAKDLNRKSIGIEIDEKYCEIAANRLAQEVLDFG